MTLVAWVVVGGCRVKGGLLGNGKDFTNNLSGLAGLLEVVGFVF